GQVSETIRYTVDEERKESEKPIFANYIGDYDPAGLTIESSLKTKLQRFTGTDFSWQRLAITPEDFDNEELLGFPVKHSGAWREYLAKCGDRGAEVDARPPNIIRDRPKDA